MSAEDSEPSLLFQEYDELRKQCTELAALLGLLTHAPESDAQEVLRRMRSSGPYAPVIASLGQICSTNVSRLPLRRRANRGSLSVGFPFSVSGSEHDPRC